MKKCFVFGVMLIFGSASPMLRVSTNMRCFSFSSLVNSKFPTAVVDTLASVGMSYLTFKQVQGLRDRKNKVLIELDREMEFYKNSGIVLDSGRYTVAENPPYKKAYSTP